MSNLKLKIMKKTKILSMKNLVILVTVILISTFTSCKKDETETDILSNEIPVDSLGNFILTGRKPNAEILKQQNLSNYLTKNDSARMYQYYYLNTNKGDSLFVDYGMSFSLNSNLVGGGGRWFTLDSCAGHKGFVASPYSTGSNAVGYSYNGYMWFIGDQNTYTVNNNVFTFTLVLSSNGFNLTNTFKVLSIDENENYMKVLVNNTYTVIMYLMRGSLQKSILTLPATSTYCSGDATMMNELSSCYKNKQIFNCFINNDINFLNPIGVHKETFVY